MMSNMFAGQFANSTATVDGVRFVGTTLWFKPGYDTYGKERLLGDYAMIPHFSDWVEQANNEAVKFLEKEMFLSDVIITHHLPAKRSIDKKFHMSALNSFFHTEMSDLIYAAQPQLIVHGHTHASVDYDVGRTKVLCNPFGYIGIDENEEFDWNKTVKICKERN